MDDSSVETDEEESDVVDNSSEITDKEGDDLVDDSSVIFPLPGDVWFPVYEQVKFDD